jgi:hypothetical protein
MANGILKLDLFFWVTAFVACFFWVSTAGNERMKKKSKLLKKIMSGTSYDKEPVIEIMHSDSPDDCGWTDLQHSIQRIKRVQTFRELESHSCCL